MPESGKISVDDALRAAIALHKQGHREEAESLYTGILEEDPDQVDALHFLGVMRHEQGRSEESVDLICRAIQRTPDDAGLQLNYGNVLREAGRLEDAEAAYRESLRLVPTQAEAHNNLGTLLRRKEDLEGARISLERAIELNPRYGEAYFNLGNLCQDLGDLNGAVEYYEKCVEFEGYRSMRLAAARNLARILVQSGKNEQATSALEHWLALEPDSPVARHMLAAAAQEKVPERAGDDYVKVLFDGFAERFDDVLGSLHYRAPKLIGELLRQLLIAPDRSRRVLDLGCGTGFGGEVAEPYASSVVGVDLSPAMLAEAETRNLYDELVEAEITRYLEACRAADFDLAISVDALCYFGDITPVVRGLGRVLKPGGLFCFTVEKTEAVEGGVGYRLERHGRYAHQRHYLRKVAVEAGFEVVRLEEGVLRLQLGQAVGGYVVAIQLAEGPRNR